jgi:hypothetical protein
MNPAQLHWLLTTAWLWLVNNSLGVLTVVISVATLFVIWRTQQAASAQAAAALEQAKAAKTQNNMSIQMLHANLGAADRQLMPLLTVKVKQERSNSLDPNLVQVAEIRNAGLGPALGISVFLEARKDTASGKVFERVDCPVETTFLPVNGTTVVPLPNLIAFQPFVIEYLSAMNTRHETRLELGDPDVQSHKILQAEYNDLLELRLD